MASVFDRQLQRKAEDIKSLVKEECDFYNIEIDEIKDNIFMGRGKVTVYLEDSSAFNQGRIGQAVKSKWPDVECEYEDDFIIEFSFRVQQ